MTLLAIPRTKPRSRGLFSMSTTVRALGRFLAPPIMESPGADIVEKYPTLPDEIYRRVVGEAVLRATAPFRTVEKIRS